MTDITSDPWPPRLTRQQASAFLTANGFPIGKRQFEKLCLPHTGEGPPVDSWWGGRTLYDPAVLLDWAQARLQKARGGRERGFTRKHEIEQIERMAVRRKPSATPTTTT